MALYVEKLTDLYAVGGCPHLPDCLCEMSPPLRGDRQEAQAGAWGVWTVTQPELKGLLVFQLWPTPPHPQPAQDFGQPHCGACLLHTSQRQRW